MILEKNNIYLLGLFILIGACKANKDFNKFSCNENFPVLDSIGYVVFPNDNWGNEGNGVFKKIKNKNELIKKCLVEKVLDTTITQFRVADAYNYRKGDLAVLLLPYVSKKNTPLRKLLKEEFSVELSGMNKENDFFESLYYFIFFSNEKEVNYKHRKRFYTKLKNYEFKN
ncbi:hypothetical protein OAT18_00115 [Tenacibaculum sp.]|nr:hypothetical protein [Tenacibaculum sp.]